MASFNAQSIMLGFSMCSFASTGAVNECGVGNLALPCSAGVDGRAEWWQETDEVQTSLLQVDSKVKHEDLKRSTACSGSSMGYSYGIHLIQLPEIGRQFLLSVPHELVASEGGAPLVLVFHGFSDSPWYTNRAGGFSSQLDRYGWLGIMPFGLNAIRNNGLNGTLACCPPGCDEDCCMNGEHLNLKDETACGWGNGEPDLQFTEALITWAGENTCADTTKVFATGFSNGGPFSNYLGCQAAHLFLGVAPISGDNFDPLCQPSRPISYISMCGSKDDEAHCQDTVSMTANHWSKVMNCTRGSEFGQPFESFKSATTTCTEWSQCSNGNTVEMCMSEGLGHDPSGHLRPDNTSYVRPASDIDFSQYSFQKFSALVGESLLFVGHPTDEELLYKESNWPPPTHSDNLWLRTGVLQAQLIGGADGLPVYVEA